MSFCKHARQNIWSYTDCILHSPKLISSSNQIQVCRNKLKILIYIFFHSYLKSIFGIEKHRAIEYFKYTKSSYPKLLCIDHRVYPYIPTVDAGTILRNEDISSGRGSNAFFSTLKSVVVFIGNFLG